MIILKYIRHRKGEDEDPEKELPNMNGGNGIAGAIKRTYNKVK